jgi:hypothetical protein
MENPAGPLPIVPFASFVTALDHFHEAGGPPSEMHASAFPKEKFSGTTTALLVKAFKRFQMEEIDGTTSLDRLDPLIDPQTRKSAIAGLLREFYGPLFDLPLESAPPSAFNKWFDDWNMNADDTRKAKTFFLHAAKYAEIPISAYILARYKTRVRTSAPSERTRKPSTQNSRATNKGKRVNPAAPGHNEPKSNVTTRTVGLRQSKGLVTLSVSADLWELDGEDRDFVLFLTDVVKAWERGASGGIWAKAVDIT